MEFFLIGNIINLMYVSTFQDMASRINYVKLIEAYSDCDFIILSNSEFSSRKRPKLAL
jgi:hypothetical protein